MLHHRQSQIVLERLSAAYLGWTKYIFVLQYVFCDSNGAVVLLTQSSSNFTTFPKISIADSTGACPDHVAEH